MSRRIRRPKVSFLFLDWNVRESFHSIEYLNRQEGVDRSDYEVIWIEHFDVVKPEVADYCRRGMIDGHLVLGLPAPYSKHRMWNEGALASRGEILVLCDSDAMYSPTCVRSIIDTFEAERDCVLYLDQIRSQNQRFWPFSYPDWEEVLATPGLLNWDPLSKQTIGVAWDVDDLRLHHGLHEPDIRFFVRNYGACFCVRRRDYFFYGGLDEHESYEGYICGPHDLGVRLVNAGLRELWHGSEFLLHTWHPCPEHQDQGLVGPHYRFNSTTTLKHAKDGSLLPFVENLDVQAVRTAGLPSRRSGRPMLSVVVESSEPWLWDRLCDSVARATRVPYEVIALGSEPPLRQRPDLRWIQLASHGAGGVSVGIEAAKGRWIAWAPPRATFRTGSIDRALRALRMRRGGRDPKKVVGLSISETRTNGQGWQPHALQRTQQQRGLLVPVGVMERSYLDELGGVDARLSTPFAMLDLCLRASAAGARVVTLADSFVDVWASAFEPSALTLEGEMHRLRQRYSLSEDVLPGPTVFPSAEMCSPSPAYQPSSCSLEGDGKRLAEGVSP